METQSKVKGRVIELVREDLASVQLRLQQKRREVKELEDFEAELKQKLAKMTAN